MHVIHSVRKTLSAASFALSSVWALAGACKLIFGIRITVPFLPPFGLEHVAAAPALATSVALLILGAWLGRLPTDTDTARRASLDAADPVALPGFSPNLVGTAAPGERGSLPRQELQDRAH